jgi:uncharacterized protein involved in type VI secretion and phage assembly
MRPFWKEKEDCIDITLTARKDIHRRNQEGQKSGIRGDHTEPYLQKKSTSTKHSLQHKTERTQRDKVIITDSLSTLAAIKGNNYTKKPTMNDQTKRDYWLPQNT